MTPSSDLARTLSLFADRLFETGGRDPGDAALAIAPSRLAVYHELLHKNYGSMLRFAFTQALRLADAELAAARGADGLPADADELIRRFLSVEPAATHSTREIADRFRHYLESHAAALFGRRPELASLLTLERAELRAAYHTDDPGRSPDDAELAALATSDVATFLAVRVLRAPSASLLCLDHAATALHHRLRHGEVPPVGAHAHAERAVVARDPRTLAPTFATWDEAAFRVLETAPEGTPIVLEELAVQWIAALPEADRARDEEWQLATFATTVASSLQSGALRLA